jgi:cis-3-alkyl-4-acyloxetan-2-one decarboxylase
MIVVLRRERIPLLHSMTSFDPPPRLPAWLEHELPFDRRVARIGEHRIHFIDHGRGRPVLLMHGNPTWSFLWRKVISRLDGMRAVAPDLIGMGLSTKPRRPSAHRLAVHVDIIASLIEALDLREAIVVGQDWGGPIGAGAAMRSADRIRGLIFANTAVLKPARPFRPKAFHRFSHLPIASDVAFRGLLFPFPMMPFTQGDRGSIGLRELRAYTWPLLSPLDRAGGLGLARMVPTSEDHPSTPIMDAIGAWVEQWRGPAALVWGRRDPILGRALGRHRAALPHASVRECDAGHFLQEEVPELIVDAIHEVAAQ